MGSPGKWYRSLLTAKAQFGTNCRHHESSAGAGCLWTKAGDADYLPNMARCQECGNNNEVGSLRCGTCNAKLGFSLSSLSETILGMPSPVLSPSADDSATRLAKQLATTSRGNNATRFGLAALEPIEDKLARRQLGLSNSEDGFRPVNLQGGLATTVQNGSPASLAFPQDDDQQLRELRRKRDLADVSTFIGGTNPMIAVPLEPKLNRMQRAEAIQIAPEARVPDFQSLGPPSLRPLGQIAKKQWIYLMLAALVSAGIGGVIAWATHEAKVVRVVNFSVDPSGKDQLLLSCEACEEGSRVHLGEAVGLVRQGKAELYPQTRLVLGRNELRFSIEDTNGHVEKAVPIILPLAFRVTTRWLTAEESIPEAEFSIEAPEGSLVRIDDELVPLQGQKAVKFFEFSEQSEGLAATVVPLDLDLPVTVEKDGRIKGSRVQMKAGICPLTLWTTRSGSPPDELTILNGKSAPGAQLSIEGKDVRADGLGDFSYELRTPHPGGVRVTAHTKELLMRTAHFDL